MTRFVAPRPIVAPLLASLLLLALSAGVVLAMYLFRGLSQLLSDQQLNNHFAYTQDLVAAPLAFLFLLSMLLVRPPHFAMPQWGCSDSRSVLIVALAVFVVSYAGARLLFGGFGPSIDEFMADFDARILRTGVLFGEVPSPMRPMVDALQPIWLFKTADGSLWASSYLPGNAAIRALFSFAGDPALAGPVLAAASVLALYAIARKLEPEDRGFAVIAVLLLVSSSQFLITAMTPYAMTAHLALNLAWLWLVLDDRPLSRAGALAVSFLACGLHQAIFHPLFALPFLPWLWWSGKRGMAVLYLLAICAFTLFWLNYWTIALTLVAPGTKPAGLLQVPLFERIQALLENAIQPSSAAHSADNLLRLLTWQNPLLWVVVIAAIIGIGRLPKFAWCLLAGFAATIAAMLLLMPAQGHGWGYRYVHGLLGSLALLGAYGWKRMFEASTIQGAQLRPWLGISVVVSLLVLFPLRTWQTNAFVRPYQQANDAIARIPADLVIIDHSGRWFAQDLVRNDPFLRNRPLRVLANKLDSDHAGRLCSALRVRVLDSSSPELSPLRPVASRRQNAESRRLPSAGCGLSGLRNR